MTDLIINRLSKLGFQVYIVGGSVRDELLGFRPKDVDISTNAKPDELVEIFKDRKIKTVGKTFGVVMVDDIEVATFRLDCYGIKDFSDKSVEIKFANTIEEDLARRDFTINALAKDPITNKIVDPFGGKDDLKNRVIRFVGDPKERIEEDILRVLRACRFMSKLKGSFEPKTFEALKIFGKKVKGSVPPERIRLEIMKSLEEKEASRFFIALESIGALDQIIPGLSSCWGFPGGSFHGETVFDHNMVTGDLLSSKNPLLKLAGYLHDIGKVAAAKLKEDSEELDFSFIQHERDGAHCARDILKSLVFSNDEISYVYSIIRLHMRPHQVQTEKAARNLIRKCEDHRVPVKDLLKIFLADKKANINPKRDDKTRVERSIQTIKLVKEASKNKHSFLKLAINGLDIIKCKGIKPGPEVGIILNKLRDLVIEDPSINSKERLLKEVEEL